MSFSIPRCELSELDLQSKGMQEVVEQASTEQAPQTALELSLLFTLRCHARRDSMGRSQHEALSSLMDNSQQQPSGTKETLVSPFSFCCSCSAAQLQFLQPLVLTLKCSCFDFLSCMCGDHD